MTRILAALIATPLALTACATQQQQTTLAQAKVWVATLSSATTAAAGVYLAQESAPKAAEVRKAVATVQAGAAAFQGINDVSNARSAALSILASVQQVMPMVTPYLGKDGVWVPIGLAVVQAFVASLPPPAGAPAEPPKTA